MDNTSTATTQSTTTQPGPQLSRRTRQEIDNDYTRCATLLGDKQFKIRFLTAEVNLLLERMSQLNQELQQNHPELTVLRQDQKQTETPSSTSATSA